MAVHPQIQELLDFIASRGVLPHYELTPAEARVNMLKGRAVLNGEQVALARVEDRTIPGPAGEIAIRLYADGRETGLPLLVYYHGGGWVMGDLDTHDDCCRRLAADSGCLVVSVDYRLAPEHKFPAAVDDSLAALNWAAAHAEELGGDAARLAVGGDSAGGTLAAVMTHLARDGKAPPISFQLLIYPATTRQSGMPSVEQYATGFPLTAQGMVWFYEHYLNGAEEGESPLVSPLLAPDLAGLPPALIVTAEYDVLRDEGEAYGEKLREAGGEVTVSRHDGMIHGFFNMTVTDGGKAGIAEAAAALRKALAG